MAALTLRTIFSGRLPLTLFAPRGEVVVQFWLKPGEAAVSLGPGEEREVERIPAQLWKFLGGATVLKTSGLALLGRLPRGLGLEYRVQEGLILNFRFGQQADSGFLGCVADNRFVAKSSARPPMQKEGRRTRQQKPRRSRVGVCGRSRLGWATQSTLSIAALQ